MIRLWRSENAGTTGAGLGHNSPKTGDLQITSGDGCESPLSALRGETLERVEILRDSAGRI